MTKELKPCECDEKSLMFGVSQDCIYHVFCEECGERGDDGFSKDEAIDLWNNRFEEVGYDTE